MPGMFVPCPPSTIRLDGDTSRTICAMRRAFSKFGMMKLIPTVS